MLYELLKEHIRASNKPSHAYASRASPILTVAYKQYVLPLST